MDKDQLISMIHFLVKREDERAQENQELKDMVKDLRDPHKHEENIDTEKNFMSLFTAINKMAEKYGMLLRW